MDDVRQQLAIATRAIASSRFRINATQDALADLRATKQLLLEKVARPVSTGIAAAGVAIISLNQINPGRLSTLRSKIKGISVVVQRVSSDRFPSRLSDYVLIERIPVENFHANGHARQKGALPSSTYAPSSISPVAICITRTALPITSAGRFWPLGPVGT